ncbi:MAG: FtsX-like permease family protein [Alphaproteobacteria bacterium]|nr:FtsX-like permease family protein [Alphaproteobacteria bacterium]
MSGVGRAAWRDIWRDLRDTELKLLALSVLLGVAALSAVALLSDRLQLGMKRDAARLLGGDVVVVSDQPTPAVFERQAQALGLISATSLSFPTMARNAQDEGRLVALKSAQSGYPLKGQLKITRKDDLSQEEDVTQLPQPGEVWVEPALAQALDLKVGDVLRVAQLSLRLSALLLSEPDRGAGFMNFAPRLFMHPDDVARSELIQPASRVTWRMALSGPAGALATYAPWASAQAQRDDVRGVRIETLEAGRPEMKQTLDRASQFLRLVALMAGFLCAVAVALSARAFALKRVNSVALLRVLGQTQRQIVARYAIESLGVGLLASLAGLALGWGLQALLVELLAGLVEAELPPPGPQPLMLGVGLGMTLLVAFGLPPILRLAQVPALRVIRRDWGTPSASSWAVWGLGLAGFIALMAQASQNLKLGSIVLGGFALALAVFAALAWVCLRLLRACVNEQTAPIWLGLATRQMAARPGLVMLQVSAMAMGWMALILLVLLRTDLMHAWRQATPADAPNRFVINIQPDQGAEFERQLRQAGVQGYDWYPMIRGRLVEVNGRSVGPEQYQDERAKRLVDREFNLSHSAALPVHNQIVAGVWAAEEADGLSIEEGIARTLGLKLGDHLHFDLAGLAVGGKVTSIRHVEWTSMRANFFVLFPRSAMPDVPMTYMTAYRSPDHAALDKKLLGLYPNITQVDLTASLNQVQSVLTQVSRAVEFLFLFALCSGLVVLVAVVVLTREERVRDHAVLRALGAQKKVLSRLQSAELMGTGALSGVLAAILALAVAWLLAHEVFDFTWRLPWSVVPLGGVLGAIVASVVGWWTLRGVLRQSVTQTLRQSES